jgi:hypothetical protein
MLPGFKRKACTPASIAASASLYWKWMSATIGTGERGTIWARPIAASSSLHVQRTMSAPAAASAVDLRQVPSTSAVLVVVIDCTETGASPPTATAPTISCRVDRRSCMPAG